MAEALQNRMVLYSRQNDRACRLVLLFGQTAAVVR